jgi:hypothetical protein
MKTISLDKPLETGSVREGLKTRTVFVDTSVFEKELFDWKGRTLSSLMALAKKRQILLLTTDITQREISDRISSRLSEAAGAATKARSQLAILKPALGKKSPVLEFKSEELAAKMISGQKRFFKASKAKTIDAYSDAQEIFDDYFNRKKPFGDGKKKSEFPDAFIIRGIRKYCSATGETVYVVSRDEDMLSACGERLIAEPDLDALISRFNLADPTADLSQVEGLVRSRSAQIVKFVEREFPGLGSLLVDQDGDVEDVVVTGVEIEDVFVLEKKPSSLVLEIVVEVEFTAELTYWDPDTASYDEGDVMYLNRVEESVVREQTVRLSAVGRFDRTKREPSITLQKLQIEEPLDVEVSSNRSDPTYFK